MSDNRAPAQYCPYCGETDLWPHEESHGAWSCRDCQRVFAVRFIGLTGSVGGNIAGQSVVVAADSEVPRTATTGMVP
ncbi:MAG: hypothetical protein M3Y35_15040 [Actinomycetota bacterium]|nr:hypothetical protein [Actinomycetota bacterium]